MDSQKIVSFWEQSWWVIYW